MTRETPLLPETPRLILRPMELADLDPLMAIFGDLMEGTPFDLAAMTRWIQRNLDVRTLSGRSGPVGSDMTQEPEPARQNDVSRPDSEQARARSEGPRVVTGAMASAE